MADLSQDHVPISVYYKKLKELWDKLINFRPIPTCAYGGLKDVIEYQQQEYVMKFRMGFNDTFTHVRGQILLMDPLPPINKVLYGFTRRTTI